MVSDTHIADLWTKRRTVYRLVFSISLLMIFVGVRSLELQAQVPTKATTRKTETPSTPKPRRPRAPRVKGTTPEDSYNFLVLGDVFWEKGKWNAAEAAYRESVRLWSGSDANGALKELHELTRVK